MLNNIVKQKSKIVEGVACHASHFIELPCQTSFFVFFLYFFISLLSVA